MSGAPGEAELGRSAGSPLAGTRDQGRDRGDVVGIRCVAESEQDRDEQNDPDAGSVRVRRNEVVESEHLEHLRQSVEGNADPDRDDRECAGGGEGADEPAV